MHRALLIDLGNRRIKAAVWSSEGTGPVAVADGARGPEAVPQLAEQLELALPHAGRIHLASTRAEDEELLAALGTADADWRRVDEASWPCPVRSTGTGADRVLGAWAAWKRVQRDSEGGDHGSGSALETTPVVVADCGSAWTLDLMNADGVFLGGAIGPGLLALEAGLSRNTPHLPPPSGRGPSGIPTTSGTALEAGTRGALAEALAGLVNRWSAELGACPRCFLTGGDAAVIAPWLEASRSEPCMPWERVDHLVLEGLGLLAEAAARSDPAEA